MYTRYACADAVRRTAVLPVPAEPRGREAADEGVREHIEQLRCPCCNEDRATVAIIVNVRSVQRLAKARRAA